VLSTAPEQDGDTYGEAFEGAGLEEPWQALKKDFPSPGQVSVLAARPIPTTQGQTKNVLVGCASLEGLNTLMRERAGLGDSGETYLVSPDHVLLTDSRFEGYPAGESRVDSQGVKATLRELTNGSGLYDDYRDVPVIGVYHWLPELQVVLLAEQDRAEALRATFVTLGLNTIVTVASVLGAVVVGLLVTRSIANPLANLTATAAQIAAGELELEVKVERGDEVGSLAQAFNSMTTQLRELIGGLEERIAHRTRALERRSAYLEASAEVGHAAASILDIDLLMRRVVELIRERFDLYYVGLFQVDSSGEWAVLRAGTGEAGRAMLARDHRIRVGAGMIGWSVANAQPRVALEAGADAVRLATAELPDTRSEAALPLRSRGRVLGALSVQDTRLETFDEDSIIMLQTMADQVAVALDNARLFAESQAALEATHLAYGELSREAWSELLRAQAGLGLRRDRRGTSAITDDDLQDEATPMRRVLPIQVRDHVIGAVKARKPQDAGAWTAEEINLLETLVEQLGVALEGARLHQEAQRHAHRERIAREITEKVRAAPDVETIAQTAVEELVKALGGARGFVKLGTRTTDGRETP
jgi:GAF domain-containing protein/HAMP domain-containing protein